MKQSSQPPPSSRARLTPPWQTDLLAEWLRDLGQETVSKRLGKLVLLSELGEVDLEGSRWSFSTGVRRPSERPPAPIDLGKALVHPLAKRSSTFFPGVLLLGRSSNNDVVIPHSSVSKLHARLRAEKDGFWVEDAGSQNGSAIDGEPIRKPVFAVAGDLLRFGDLNFQLVDARILMRSLSRA